MTVKDLHDYITENIESGILRGNDKVYVHDGCEFLEANAVFNDAHMLSIAPDDCFMGEQEVL